MGTTYEGFNFGCTVVSETEEKLIRDNQGGCEILRFFCFVLFIFYKFVT